MNNNLHETLINFFFQNVFAQNLYEFYYTFTYYLFVFSFEFTY